MLGRHSCLDEAETDPKRHQGKHAEAFREQFDDNFRPKIDEAKRSFRKAATALRDWFEGMQEWRSKAAALESRAQDARDKHDALKGKLAGLPPKHASFDSPKDGAEARKRERTEKDPSSTELAAGIAEGELEKIRAQACKPASDYALEEQSVARRLDKAMDIAPNEPGALHKLGSALKDIGKVPGKLDDAVLDAIDAGVAAAVEWLSSHANAIAALGDVVATVSAALGAISLVPLFCSAAFPPSGQPSPYAFHQQAPPLGPGVPSSSTAIRRRNLPFPVSSEHSAAVRQRVRRRKSPVRPALGTGAGWRRGWPGRARERVHARCRRAGPHDSGPSTPRRRG
ncbi:hypothetical protein [Streptomyces sp. NBC_01089]|uniref:hypothetical protein n=1 Tax=Streptomyces sp. NBC_01089 TaxID=2903747 RepID=UPI0038681AB1|nr:hypothetical protein OG510_20245 [Streptomyces sp. NBC_01089]